MSSTTPPVIVWLRSDLRLHDHPALHAALSSAQLNAGQLLMLWFWPDDHAAEPLPGVRRIETPRAHFMIKSAQQLQRAVHERGGKLLLLEGRADQLIPQIASSLGAHQVFAHHAVAADERQEEQRVAERLAHQGAELKLKWGHTLLEQRQLPMPLERLPDVFTQFRKKVERAEQPLPPLPAPERLPSAPGGLDEDLEVLELKVVSAPSAWAPDERSALPLAELGESGGLARLKSYLWDRGLIESYKETRNGLVGEAYSTKLSPWLSTGCLSPRLAWAEVLRYERERVENDSTYWVRFELLWREYFQWVALKWGARLFQAGGLKSNAPLRRAPIELSSRARRDFERWRAGATEDDFVNANMRELNATGFMSNRGRQNVASYLVHDLGVDWRAGATYFESLLIDYDPASNWGNWAYVAGVGNDPRPQRRFNTLRQAQMYDGDYSLRDLWADERLS